MKKLITHTRKVYWGLMLFGVSLFLTCQQNKDLVEITFGFNDVEQENIQPLLDQFNELHAGKINVNWQKTSAVSDEFYQQLKNDFESDAVKNDVFGSDVVWTATFASNGWIENLSPKFYQKYNPADFVEPALRSVVYNFKIWGVPWYTDTGIIFMRKDLMEKHGIREAPKTWAELKRIARKVMQESQIENGYVFQGAAYEGGVTNACEFIWNANGSILLGDLFMPEGGMDKDIPQDIITVDSKASEKGFAMAKSLITEGIAPEAVVEFKEADAIDVFQNGRAVFMRGWPGNYSSFLKPDSKVKASQVSVCPIPALEEGGTSYSCLGGWNLMINAKSSEDKKEAAWAFIQFMNEAKQQKFRALNGGNLPVLKALYDDEEILNQVEVISLAKGALQNARSRPISPLYMQMAPKISNSFNQVLRGAIEPEYAVSVLQMELENLGESVSLNSN